MRNCTDIKAGWYYSSVERMSEEKDHQAGAAKGGESHE